MSLFIASLNSGSNGNCYYAGTEQDAILVDAGISCRETEKRMKRLGLSMKNIRAIFISHEHTDHINGLTLLARKYHLPIYITEETGRQCGLSADMYELIPFSAFYPVNIGEIRITAFPKFHDACDPHSFIVSSSAVNVGIFTDIGIVCTQLINYFRQCHAVFLESNYDVEMLKKGGYPQHLKNRISGGSGHLSNIQALQLVMDHKPAFMSHIILSHLSKNNNDPELVYDLFNQNIKDATIVVASRYAETALYHIQPGQSPLTGPLEKINSIKQKKQLSLF
jgi:phosphoribosyl 1,2-cyclic phosphodiesterase